MTHQDTQSDERPRVQRTHTEAGVNKPVDKKAEKDLSNLRENLQKKYLDYENKINKMFEKHISASKLQDVATNEAYKLRNEQLKAAKEKFEKVYRRVAAEQNAGNVERNNLAQQLFNETDEEVKIMVQNTEVLLKLAVKGTYMNEQEIIALRSSLMGIQKLAKEKPQTQKIMKKFEKKERNRLSPEDYDQVIEMIRPIDLQKNLTSGKVPPEESFEATSAGVIISCMNAEERNQLIERLMDSPKQNQTGEILDAFLQTGTLNVRQGEMLFKRALEKGVVDEDAYEQKYAKRFQEGFYAKQVVMMNKKIEEEAEYLKNARFAANNMNLLVGDPLVGIVLTAHSAMWMLTNVLSSGLDKDNIGESIGRILNNPYVYVAAVEGLAGLEMATGGMRANVANHGFGSGIVSRGFEWATERKGKETPAERAKNLLSEMYLQHPEFGNYLELDGGKSILKLHEKKVAQHKENPSIPSHMSYEELLEEGDEKQQLQLELAMKTSSKETVTGYINIFPEMCKQLKIKDQKDLQIMLDQIKEKKGVPNA